MEVSLCDLLQYIGDRTRPLKEGEALVQAGFIINCGLEMGTSTKARALCLQSSKIQNQPHEITIEWSEKVKKCSCTCKAGQSGFCKHAVGALIYINRHERLDLLSCTDVAQQWGKTKKRIYEDVVVDYDIEEFCHMKRSYDWASNQTLDKENFLSCVSTAPSSSLGTMIQRAKKKSGFTVSAFPSNNAAIREILEYAATSQFLQAFNFQLELKPCCNMVMERLEQTDIFAVATSAQGSEIWKDARQLRITGTKCYAIYTAKGNWENVINSTFFPKPFFSKYTEYGSKHEKAALECYRVKRGVNIVNTGFIICSALPWYGISPDGIVTENGKPSYLLEIKCPYSGKTNAATSFIDTCNYIYLLSKDKASLKKKHRYYGQIQLGLALLNLKKAILILYSSFSKDFIEIEVEYDEQFCNDLIQITTHKYFNYILHGYCINNK